MSESKIPVVIFAPVGVFSNVEEGSWTRAAPDVASLQVVGIMDLVPETPAAFADLQALAAEHGATVKLAAAAAPLGGMQVDILMAYHIVTPSLACAAEIPGAYIIYDRSGAISEDPAA